MHMQTVHARASDGSGRNCYHNDEKPTEMSSVEYNPDRIHQMKYTKAYPIITENK